MKVLFALKHKLTYEVSDVDKCEFLFNPWKPKAHTSVVKDPDRTAL